MPVPTRTISRNISRVTGRAPANISVGNAKSLSEISAVLRLLYRKNVRRMDDGKRALAKKVAAILNKHREAATQDLKQQLGQQKKMVLPPPKGAKRPPESTGEAKPSKKRPRPTTRGGEHQKLKAIRDKDRDPEPEHSGKEDGDTKDEDEEFLGPKDVPSPPNSVDDMDEAEDDEVVESEELERCLQESDEDADVFAGDFAVKTKNEEKKEDEETTKAVPAKVQQYLEKLDKDLVSVIPKDLTESGYANFVRLLNAEGLLKLDDIKAISSLPGTISGSLGPGKGFYNKLSIKAKAALDPWGQRPSRLPTGGQRELQRAAAELFLDWLKGLGDDDASWVQCSLYFMA
ncbi:unnamed protein product [Symbiodinium sp. KB8]|nr:unnamed protein product [Symbiodinium sp. KB8]